MRKIDERLPLVQNAPIDGKVVLVRFDHNVVKNGQIRDPYRIDRTLGTLYNIVERGGRPILMTHIGRPKDKKTGKIPTEEELARWQRVRPIMNEILQDKGLINVAESKVYVTGMKGPLEEGWQKKAKAFAAQIPNLP